MEDRTVTRGACVLRALIGTCLLEYWGVRRARNWDWVQLKTADLVPSTGNCASAGNAGLQMEGCVKSKAGVVCSVEYTVGIQMLAGTWRMHFKI